MKHDAWWFTVLGFVIFFGVISVIGAIAKTFGYLRRNQLQVIDCNVCISHENEI
jgi:hypothetical protein